MLKSLPKVAATLARDQFSHVRSRALRRARKRLNHRTMRDAGLLPSLSGTAFALSLAR
jgi:hypothetical protein